MVHQNGRLIYQVSREELERNGGAYVVPVVREERGVKTVVLIGVSTIDFPGAGWMPKERVRDN